MAPKLIFDITAVTEQVGHLVKGCLEVAHDQLVGTMTNIKLEGPTSNDIVGLREQILGKWCLPCHLWASS